MNFAAIENALHAWLVTASGLAGAAVVFSDQVGDPGAGQPAGTFLTVRIGDETTVGMDGLAQDFNPNAAAGQEVIFTVTGWRAFTVSVQAFSEPTTGDSSARAVLEKCKTALTLPAVRDALNAAGLSPYDPAAVRNLSALRERGSNFEGRALLEVRFYAVDTATESTGYIATLTQPAGTYSGGGYVAPPPPRPYALGFASAHTNGVPPTYHTSFVVPNTLDLWIDVIVNTVLSPGAHQARIDWLLPGGAQYNTWIWSFDMATNPDGNRVWIPGSYSLSGSTIEQFALYGIHTFTLRIDNVLITDSLAPLPAPLTLTGS